MKLLVPIIGWLVLSAGCSTHYHRSDGHSLTLYLDRPSARQVYLASSQDGFAPHEARRVGRMWVVSLPAASQFRYYYIVDGEIFVPSCRMKENDDFGSKNCIFSQEL